MSSTVAAVLSTRESNHRNMRCKTGSSFPSGSSHQLLHVTHVATFQIIKEIKYSIRHVKGLMSKSINKMMNEISTRDEPIIIALDIPLKYVVVQYMPAQLV